MPTSKDSAFAKTLAAGARAQLNNLQTGTVRLKGDKRVFAIRGKGPTITDQKEAENGNVLITVRVPLKWHGVASKPRVLAGLSEVTGEVNRARYLGVSVRASKPASNHFDLLLEVHFDTQLKYLSVWWILIP